MKKRRKRINPEKIRSDHMQEAITEMNNLAMNDMGAITTAQIGKFSRGWIGKKKKD